MLEWKAYRRNIRPQKFTSHHKYHLVYKKHRYELVDQPNKQPNRRFLLNDLASKIIMDCWRNESCNHKRNKEI